MVWEAAAIGAGASLVGNALEYLGGRQSQADQIAWAREQMTRQEQLQRELATRSEYLQQLFASNQLQWKAQDARNAGIHPIFAMGASPVSASGYAGSLSPVGGPSGNPAEAFGDMGQDISRMAIAVMDNKERRRATELAREQYALGAEQRMAEIDLTRAQTQVALSQAARLRGQVGPGYPSDQDQGEVRQSALGPYISRPTDVTPHAPDDRSTVAGPANPLIKFGWSSRGALQIFANDKLISDQELENPFMLRWLATEGFPTSVGAVTAKHMKTVLAHIRSEYPNATGYYFDVEKVGYMPLFGRAGERTASGAPARTGRHIMSHQYPMHGRAGSWPVGRVPGDYSGGSRRGIQSLY